MATAKTINIIDIGTSKITTIIAHAVNSQINIIAITTTPAEGFRRGSIVDPEIASQSLTRSIESAERMAGLEIKSAHIGYCDSTFESLNTQADISISNPHNEITPADVARIQKACRQSPLPINKEVVSLLPKKYSIDDQLDIINPVGMTGNKLHLEAHLITASNNSLRNLEKLFSDIGTDIDSVTHSGLASAKSVLEHSENELGTCLVDIGGSLSTIVVIYENAPIFSQVIPIGGNHLTIDLAVGLRLSVPDAEKVKIELGHAYQKNRSLPPEINLGTNQISTITTINGIVRPRLEEIAKIIKQHLDSEHLQNKTPSGVVVTGGGALSPSLIDTFSQTLNTPVRLGTPRKLGGLSDETTSPIHATSVGLLLQSLPGSLPPATSSKKHSTNNLVGRLRRLIEPLLP